MAKQLLRGFSVNREVLVENLKQQSLVSQRIVYNYMTVGQSANLHEFQIQRELLLSCNGAHAKYVAALENEKKVHVKMRRQKKEVFQKKSPKSKERNWMLSNAFCHLKLSLKNIVYKPKRNKI